MVKRINISFLDPNKIETELAAEQDLSGKKRERKENRKIHSTEKRFYANQCTQDFSKHKNSEIKEKNILITKLF